MDVKDIAFPHLEIYLKNVPKSFEVFGISIAVYGMVIAFGMMAGVLLAAYDAKKTGQDPDIYWDFALYAIFFSIIGARIYYVVFSWDYYKDHLLDVFKLRQGGLAIYGGVIAAFLTLFIYGKRKKVSFFQMGDTGTKGLVLGQIIGRWGNFFNREAFGGYTDNLFAMRLPVEAVRSSDVTLEIMSHVEEGLSYIQVHPTFLYESLWNTALLFLMLWLEPRKKFQGEVTCMYLCGYGVGRFFIEGLRTDQLLIPGIGLPVSQLLAFFMSIVFGLCILVFEWKFRKKKN